MFFLCFGVIIGGLTFLYCIFALCKRIWDSDVIFEGFGCFSVLVLFIFVCCLLFGSGTSFISTSKSVGHSHYFNMKHIYEDCKYVIAPQKVSDFGALCRGISGSCPICEDRQVREREVEKLQREDKDKTEMRAYLLRLLNRLEDGLSASDIEESLREEYSQSDDDVNDDYGEPGVPSRYQ